MFRMSFFNVAGLVSKTLSSRAVTKSRLIAAATLGLSLLAAPQFAFAAPAHNAITHAAIAVGGPFEPIDTTAAKTQADPQFRALFQSWKQLDRSAQATIAIPSLKPVSSMIFTSGFGVRSDPFRGSAAMHAGVDMPGPVGTNIYATADGVVSRSERAGGYGNLVEIDHGRGIQTRYGHLSASLVTPGQRVKRGQLIARMGSTGRSTGSHLHYEVRLDGHAVNPMPFLQSATYLAAIPAHTGNTQLAMGGPAR